MVTIFIIGRIMLGLYFVWNGFNHFKNRKGLAGYAASKKVPLAEGAVLATGAMMFFGGLAVVFGRGSVIGMWILVAFLVPTTFFMHAFWKETDPGTRMAEEINFLKNFALVGAFLMLIALETVIF